MLSASGGYSDSPHLLNTLDVGVSLNLGSPNEKCTPPGPGVGMGGELGRLGENCIPQGNVLIIQDSSTEVLDDSRGGVITFDFYPKAQAVYAMGLMDIDRHPIPQFQLFIKPSGCCQRPLPLQFLTLVTTLYRRFRSIFCVYHKFRSISQAQVR